MDAVHANVNKYHGLLDKELSKYPYLKDLETRTKVPKVTLVLTVVSTFFSLIFFNIGGQLITDLIAWVYPAYASFKALETPGTEDDVQWLTYWTVFGFVNVIEFFLDFLLFWFPFYFVFKTALVLWLALPQFRGAEYIYQNFLRGFLNSYEKSVDAVGSKLKSKVAASLEEDPKSQ